MRARRSQRYRARRPRRNRARSCSRSGPIEHESPSSVIPFGTLRPRCGRAALRRREHRDRRTAFGRLEDDAYGLTDPHRVEIAVDDVGHHRRPFVERHVRDRVRLGHAAHDAVGVDRPSPRGRPPLGGVAAAERTDRARVVVGLIALRAVLDHQTAFSRGVPERLRLRHHLRRLDLPGLRRGHHSLSMISVALMCRVPSEPPVPCASATSQFFTCTLGCASPRSWRTASMTFVMPPRLAGWLLQSPPPSVLKGSRPTPEIKLPSATNLPPCPFSQKPRSSSVMTTVIVKLS